MKTLGGSHWQYPRKVYEVIYENETYTLRIWKLHKGEYVYQNMGNLVESVVHPKMEEDNYFLKIEDALEFIYQDEEKR